MSKKVLLARPAGVVPAAVGKGGAVMTDAELARAIAEKAAEQGGTVYFVGGCVRDRLLGLENKDIDIEVHGIPAEALEQLLSELGACMKIGKSFGIYGLKGHALDIALPRTERRTGVGHRDFAVTSDPFLGTYEAAKRRDFTMNALMQNVLTGEIIDHFGGRQDLQDGVLRHVDDVTFTEDPLRVLRAAIIEMMSGAAVDVDVTSFQNDTVSFANRDDVLTYLIHLGYLAYDQDREQVFIPNEEIRHELNNAVKRNKWNEMITFQKESADLLDATLDMDEKAVADGIERIHQEYSSVIQYNDENSLSSVLTIAYLSSMQYYFQPVRELPTGRGFADFVYLPKPEYRTSYPALLVELKWNKSTDTAIEQIWDKKYPDSILEYTGNILLVGINYNKKTKEHECRIEKIKR